MPGGSLRFKDNKLLAFVHCWHNYRQARQTLCQPQGCSEDGRILDRAEPWASLGRGYLPSQPLFPRLGSEGQFSCQWKTIFLASTHTTRPHAGSTSAPQHRAELIDGPAPKPRGGVRGKHGFGASPLCFTNSVIKMYDRGKWWALETFSQGLWFTSMRQCWD